METLDHRELVAMSHQELLEVAQRLNVAVQERITQEKLRRSILQTERK